MSYTVYGVRVKGDREVRYIGMTSGKPSVRLSSHRCIADAAFKQWLRDHAVECFAIAEVESAQEARATEAVVISLCLRLNHRLFNREHVPLHLRAAPQAAREHNTPGFTPCSPAKSARCHAPDRARSLICART